MAQSLNTRSDFATEAIAYLGFVEYGKIMVGDVAFEFFNDKNVEKNMQFPWTSIKKIEGDVSKNGKIGRQFIVVFHNNSRVRFSSKNAGTILKWARHYLGNDKIVRTASFMDTVKRAFTFKRKK